jgi:hypothetical protein
MIRLDSFLNTKVYFAFILFLIAVIIAFWHSYFSVLTFQPTVLNHLHGLSMTLWVLLLIIQPLLIRYNLKSIHRTIGTFSYLLFPFILISILLLLKNNMKGVSLDNNFTLAFQALVLMSALAFAIIYILAIKNKSRSDIHARYMVSTLFPIVTPVTDRLISRYFQSWVAYAPQIGGNPVLPYFGFLLADALILILLIWDLRSNKRKDVFPVVFVIVLLFQVSVFTLYKFPWWKEFCSWFLNL